MVIPPRASASDSRFSLRAYRNVGHYGRPVYAILRDGVIVGELLFDGGRPKNAGGPAWVATLFQENGCHVVYYGNRRDYGGALMQLKSDAYHLSRVAVRTEHLVLKRPLTYKDGVLLNE